METTNPEMNEHGDSPGRLAAAINTHGIDINVVRREVTPPLNLLPPSAIRKADASNAVLMAPARTAGGWCVLARAGEIAVLVGEGGCGKSSIAQEAVMTADAASRLGVPWGVLGCGLAVAGVPAVYAGYDDSLGRLGERRRAIAAALREGGASAPAEQAPPEDWHRCDPSDLAIAFAGGGGELYVKLHDPLWERSLRKGEPPGPTQAYRQLVDGVAKAGAGLLVVDPAAGAYASNWNNGAQVRSFLAVLAADAASHGYAVLLLATPPKSARGVPASERGYSAIAGSRQWQDAARGALVLTMAQADTTVKPRVNANGTTPEMIAAWKMRHERALQWAQAYRRVLAVIKPADGISGWDWPVALRNAPNWAYAGWARAGDEVNGGREGALPAGV